jgi:hypothetical protein
VLIALVEKPPVEIRSGTQRGTVGGSIPDDPVGTELPSNASD